MRACRFHPRTVVQLGCSCRVSIFGKVPNGSADSVLWKRISPASGSRLATTIMATPGKSSDMTVTETAARPVRRLKWQLAQSREIVVETYRVKSLLLHVVNWQGHLSGQHAPSLCADMIFGNDTSSVFLATEVTNEGVEGGREEKAETGHAQHPEQHRCAQRL